MTESRADTEELPYLIRLLDDDSETVREAVRKRLFAMRGSLENELARYDIDLSAEQRRLVGDFFREEGRQVLLEGWTGWRDAPDEFSRLEAGLTRLSDFLRGYRGEPGRVAGMLDALEERCRFKKADRDIDSLNDYLFCSGRFLGNRNDYYGPQNSDLTSVIETGRGNPISLACLMILIGRRCGLEVDGCNYPGHFLARYEIGGSVYLLDCFNRGKVIPGADLIEHQPFSSHEVSEAVQNPASAEVILLRVLRNLETAFSRLGNREDQKVVRKLIQLTLP